MRDVKDMQYLAIVANKAYSISREDEEKDSSPKL
jgi:hypothetical protein